MTQNKKFWQGEGVRKTFTHRLNKDWLRWINGRHTVLDVGCGYGRLTPDLKALGVESIVGYDISPDLIERAVKENPGACYLSDTREMLGKDFDLVLCFAVFTSCPADDDQQALVHLIESVTKSGAHLYISDYEMRDNPSYLKRYHEKKLNILGCFESGGGRFRHHEQSHFETLFSNWYKLEEAKVSAQTMNGNPIQVRQYLLQRK